MFLKNLELYNFRNYENLKLHFNNNINIFIGNNAQGKTNILESIYFLSLSKSHRCNKEFMLIKNDCIYTKVRGVVEKNRINSAYEILLNKEGKRVSINKNIVKKISDYISNINTIMFCPDDLEIIKGSPHHRRSFLNIEIGQYDNNYIKVLNEYNKILKNRNEYLKYNNIDDHYLEIITDKLIEKNIEIYNYRSNFIDKINKYISKIYQNITKKDNIFVTYDSFIENKNLKDIFTQIKDKYKSVLESEKYQKTTLIGVHRDDFSIYIDNVKINNYGSQGQLRIAILCFKFSEIEMYKSQNKIPIILLDDIFSELDKTKKNNIIKYIQGESQIFITTTDLSNIDKKLKKNADIFNIKEGQVTRGE